MKVYWIENYEVCDEDGDTFWVDAVLIQHNQKKTAANIYYNDNTTLYIYYNDSPDFIDFKLTDAEYQNLIEVLLREGHAVHRL